MTLLSFEGPSPSSNSPAFPHTLLLPAWTLKETKKRKQTICHRLSGTWMKKWVEKILYTGTQGAPFIAGLHINWQNLFGRQPDNVNQKIYNYSYPLTQQFHFKEYIYSRKRTNHAHIQRFSCKNALGIIVENNEII